MAFKPPDSDLPSLRVQAAVISLSEERRGTVAPLQLMHFLQRLGETGAFSEGRVLAMRRLSQLLGGDLLPLRDVKLPV